MCDEHRDALLDALALVQAQLAEDPAALRAVLDMGDNRAQAAALARLMAAVLMMEHDEPQLVLGKFRAMYGAG
jgi:hypothetical protein